MYKSDTHGIIPNEAANHHKSLYHSIIKQALEQANVKKIDLIAFSRGPGLGPSLHVGLQAAKEYSKELNADIIGVNHAAGHLSLGQWLTKTKDPVFLYLSGANTQIIAVENKRFRIFGEALDIAIGNALDKFAREIGLGFPGGPKVEELSKKGKYIELPYTVKGMDVSFSGLVTKCTELFKKGISKEDLCFSLQETAFAMLTEVTERALAHTRKDEVLIIGGVAANQRLCNMLDIMCKERGAKFYAVPIKMAGDNGVQIAVQGLKEYQAGRKDKNLEIKPYERIDEVEVIWQL